MIKGCTTAVQEEEFLAFGKFCISKIYYELSVLIFKIVTFIWDGHFQTLNFERTKI